jgi:hypothetical protein
MIPLSKLPAWSEDDMNNLIKTLFASVGTFSPAKM